MLLASRILHFLQLVTRGGPAWLRRRRPARLALLLVALPVLAQPGRPGPPPAPTLTLQAVPAAITPTQFYVAAVLDARPERHAVAAMLPRPAQPGGPAPAPEAVDLQGGGLAAICEFVARSVPRAAGLRPVTVRLRECRLQETPGAPGWATGKLTLALSFEWLRNGRTIALTTYTGAARYQRPLTSAYAAAEPALRQALVAALQYFDGWMNREAAANAKLALRLQVHPSNSPFRHEADTLFYSPAHPLSYPDFLAVPRPRNGAVGAVFPSFAYTAQAQALNGVLHLHLQTKVFVVRTNSWLLPSAHDAYSLNHEQRHFDLVQLVAERFKRKVTPDSLTLDNYDARMQFQFLQSWREMNQLQDQYDAETSHGQNQAAQQRWNERIEAELRRYGVK
ncbi:hypothetical protein LJ737_05050 [Hymenobacter sp. 15J16-1T3B]|uniref:hypothetical protein n=1 Tax=Hymenobacter sp. 15J16-1T3B TaxID=2886941 RepID=UPI001D0F8443|nr:hypothetical protein [Hymenobacter sp. 15J16-1T3B]MCC3156594.1 hypothetical protein [Hymenobacter sp. 15J16-1T3B]